MIHFGCTAFITGRRSLFSMSHDMFLSVKVERPHGSIEEARNHFGDNGSGGGAGGVSSFSPSLFLLLAVADGKHECEEGREQRCAREGKPTGLKRGETKRFEAPTTRINYGHRNVSSQP
jgi:hypothetical protein